jgi:hypothetical protein
MTSSFKLRETVATLMLSLSSESDWVMVFAELCWLGVGIAVVFMLIAGF